MSTTLILWCSSIVVVILVMIFLNRGQTIIIRCFDEEERETKKADANNPTENNISYAPMVINENSNTLTTKNIISKDENICISSSETGNYMRVKSENRSSIMFDCCVSFGIDISSIELVIELEDGDTVFPCVKFRNKVYSYHGGKSVVFENENYKLVHPRRNEDDENAIELFASLTEENMTPNQFKLVCSQGDFNLKEIRINDVHFVFQHL